MSENGYFADVVTTVEFIDEIIELKKSALTFFILHVNIFFSGVRYFDKLGYLAF